MEGEMRALGIAVIAECSGGADASAGCTGRACVRYAEGGEPQPNQIRVHPGLSKRQISQRAEQTQAIPTRLPGLPGLAIFDSPRHDGFAAASQHAEHLAA